MTHVVQLSPTVAPRLEAPRRDAAVPGVRAGIPSVRTDVVYVVYTTVDETLAAVRTALDFANVLNVPVTVVHVRTVSYSLPVDAPAGISPIETEDFRQRLLADGLHVNLNVTLCRDERAAVTSVFGGHALIVVAGRRRWWPTRAQRLRRALEAAGHFVVFVDTRAGRAGAPRAADIVSPILEAREGTRHA